jgi:hypothetical protein
MFRKKTLYVVALVIVLVWTYYMYTNKEYFIREHLANSPPTSYAIQKQLKDLNDKVDNLTMKFQDQNDKMQAQAQQAAAVKASLDAIPTGYNSTIPTR